MGSNLMKRLFCRSLFSQHPLHHLERRREPGGVEPDVLLPPVQPRVAAVPVEHVGVGDHRVVLAVLVVQRALLGGDAVRDVPDPHVRRRGAEEPLAVGLHLPPRDHLHHHGARAQEHHVGQARAVRPHEHVARVHLARHRVHARHRRRLHAHRLETGPLDRADDGVLVHEPPRRSPEDDHEPGLPAAGRSPWERSGRWRQGVGAPDEQAEGAHVVVVRGARRVDVEVAVAAKSDDEVRVAAHLAVSVEVDHLVLRQRPEDAPVLADEPGLGAGGDELNVAAEGPGRREERDQHVAERVPVVERQAAEREHHGRHAPADGAVGRLVEGRQVEGPDDDLAYADHLAGLRPDAPGGRRGGGELRRRWDEVDRRLVDAARRARVAPHLAAVVTPVGEVADWLQRRWNGDRCNFFITTCKRVKRNF